jgi:hypothetical protein
MHRLAYDSRRTHWLSAPSRSRVAVATFGHVPICRSEALFVPAINFLITGREESQLAATGILLVSWLHSYLSIEHDVAFASPLDTAYREFGTRSTHPREFGLPFGKTMT